MQISDIDNQHLNPTVREGIGSQFSVLTGLSLLGIVGFCFASLATWSVADPSLSYANGGEASNILGYPGAIFADIAMQFFGLASAIALIPPALWGWAKLLQRRVTNLKTRSVLWLLSIAASGIAFSCFQIPQNWPLPVGLGGVIGDMGLKLPALISGEVSGWLAVLMAVLSGALGIFLTLAASGLIWNNQPIQPDPSDESYIDELVDDEEDSSNWFLGAISHYYFVAKMRLKAKRATRDELSEYETEPRIGMIARLIAKAKAIQTKFTGTSDDGLDAFDYANQQTQQGHSVSQEHGYDPNAPEMQPAYRDEQLNNPDYGENVYNEYAENQAIEDEWAPKPVPQAQQPANNAPAPMDTRVQQMAPPPKPSSRVVREAQPSLIAMSDFELPTLNFLQEVPIKAASMQLSEQALEQNARLLEGVLEDFGVKGEIIKVHPGPVVTLYELEPAPGIKSSRVIGLADDIARSMSAIAARVAVVPGRNAIGIELPNSNRETVYLREILSSQAYEKSKAKLPLILGKTIGGEPTIADLAKMPHLLVAGTTGSGKSVAINTMILSILYRFSPEQVKMIMIDPKMLELSIYDGIPHLLTPVVTDPKKAVVALKWTVREMEERYKKMSKIGVRNIDGFNNRIAEAAKKKETISRTIQTGYDRDTGEAIYETEHLELEAMPYIVVIIDEMADLMMVAGKDIEGTVQRLAQMARAAGIHVIMATQRPSVDVITGTIKANFPTRISFQVTSKIDSRTILGEQGAEQLLGMGDMLYMAGGGRIQRVHGPFVADDEVDQVVNHLKTQGIPQYLEAVTEEDEETESTNGASGDAGGMSESNDIYDRAVAIVLADRKVSTSYIQRRLSIGYNRAATLIERMEEEELISAANHAGKREILVPDPDDTM